METLQNLKQLLQSNSIVELSNENDVFEVTFSKVRSHFVLRKNGMVTMTSKTLKRVEMGLPSDLEVTDLF